MKLMPSVCALPPLTKNPGYVADLSRGFKTTSAYCSFVNFYKWSEIVLRDNKKQSIV